MDPEPHLIEDEIGLKLIAPKDGWRNRPDMKGRAAARFRAGVAIRARFVEDLVAKEVGRGVTQYVILGAGLDTFAQRNPELASRLQVFEVDRPDAQMWKKQRLMELGYGVPAGLHFVPVDFEAGDSWLSRLVEDSFDAARPAVIASTGVSMYLTREAIQSTLEQAASVAEGSSFAMTFLLPGESAKRSRPSRGQGGKTAAARRRGPFISFFTPDEMLTMARAAGFKKAQHFSGIELTERYFPAGWNGIPRSSAEEMLVATT
jgi:methyltransferase (TIGR00027 family)